MSQQPQSMSCQPTAAPSQDWTQVPDEELEVLMDDSKGTEQAKEAKRNECLAWEQAEWEQWAQEECKRQRAKEAAQQTMSGKGKGHVEELQREGQLMQMTRCIAHSWMGSMPIYSPMTGAKLSEMVVLIYWAACNECQQKQKKKCSCVAKGHKALMSGTRKWAGTGGSQGEKKKRGWSGAEDDEADEEVGVNKGSEMSAPQFEVAGSHLVGERERRHRWAPDNKYHRQLLVAQEQQVMVMEQQAVAVKQMAAAQEAQVVAVQVYMQVGVPQGGASSATEAVGKQGGSGVREGMKSGGLEQEDSGEEWGNEMDNE
ncbi:hypothetical protein PISMIDRAFT_18617 [Pisolithus microcarpus 441]|uniref:Unplaced genomic scaffold scaffold_381, whole genome shotgun sequence n=1 Tax=Pisolithus microcarpus 441 TaxID=765257 RepID=A0A0C9XJX3_9AGAM|nr:hypothetical protein PISMIDRAFT_18617 [Pisolithus microcarpus 441]